MSYPKTGSTGDGYKWLEKMGHKINNPEPALVPMIVKEDWPKKLQGLSLKNIQITFKQDKIIEKVFGECLFTHFGISGPIVLTISERIGECLKKGDVKACLDLKPKIEFKTLDSRLQKGFQKMANKTFKNLLNDYLPKKIISVFIGLSGIDPDKKVNIITKEERHKIVSLFKKIEITITGLMGFDWAIVTKGGIDIKEIDPITMKSKIFNNLYFAGEIIDINGTTGGFNLQACWSTGYLAGNNA